MLAYKVTFADKVICQDCSFSSYSYFRMKGLLGRKNLESGAGIWLKPCNSIHMFFMCFAIDAIFLDKSNRVLRIYHEIKPWRISSILWSAHSVLEINAGESARLGLNVGDQLCFKLSKP
jgi:uncharacterized protein